MGLGLFLFRIVMVPGDEIFNVAGERDFERLALQVFQY